MDPTRVPAAFGDRRHARILLELRGGGLACAWFANSHEEPRGEDRTGARERLKEGEVGIGWGELRNSVVEVVDGLQGDAELGHESPDEAHMGRDDPRSCRERAGAVDRLDAWGDDAGLHMMLAKEALKGGTACLLDRFEGWPLGEEVAEEGRVVVGEPCQDLRTIVVQGAREAVGQTDLVLYQAPAEFHELIQGAHRGTLRGEHLECITVFEESFALEFRIRGVILGSTGCEGLTVFGHRERVDGEEPQKVMGTSSRNKRTWGQLEADGHRLTAEAGAERTRPGVDRLGRVFHHTEFPGVGASRLQTDRVCGIRPVEADKRRACLYR
jgi:hypothetical protein